MKSTLLALASLGSIALGCSVPEPAIDIESERRALRSAAEAYHAAGRALDAAKLASFYGAGSRTLPPGAPDEVGPDGFRKVAEGMLALPDFQASFSDVQAEVSSGGDMGYTIAVMEASFQGPQGETVQEKFRDFHLWVKDADGSWKVAVDIWNSTLPPASP
jgi:ketosteroid isomerase-like protein